MKKTGRVIVVGGGIGGLSAALALRSRGIDVTLLERADEFGEVGAGLQLAPNATRILDEWGLLGETMRQGFEPRSLVLKDAVSGDELTRQDLGTDFRNRYGAPYVVIHRSDLHAIVLEAARSAGVELVTGAEVVAVTDLEPGVRVTVAGGGSLRAEACVAADGLTSRIRDALVGDEPVASGYVAYRGTLPESDGLDDVIAWLGPGCHFVRYPLRQGELLNQVAVFRSARYAAGAEDWGTVDELDAAFAGCCDEIRAGTPHLWRDRRWPMFDRVPTTRWRHGSTLLAGDAAHPMLQYLAQGACQAIEDAAALGRAVDTVGTRVLTEAAWPGVFDAVAAEREPRTSRVQRTAHLWGDIWHTDGLGRTLRNELLRRRDTKDFRYFDWLYGAA